MFTVEEVANFKQAGAEILDELNFQLLWSGRDDRQRSIKKLSFRLLDKKFDFALDVIKDERDRSDMLPDSEYKNKKVYYQLIHYNKKKEKLKKRYSIIICQEISRAWSDVFRTFIFRFSKPIVSTVKVLEIPEVTKIIHTHEEVVLENFTIEG